LDLPFVSVIVLNYNGHKYIANCLDTILKNTYQDFELIVVDNASTDGSLKTVQDLFGSHPKVRIIVSPTNLGFSGGNNLGFEQSKGQYIVFVNNDTTVPPDWLTPLVEAMENDASIGIAQSMIYSIDGKKIQSAGYIYSNGLIKKEQLYGGQSSDILFEPIFEVSFACGASMIIRRDILERMGAFEPEIPFFYDDTLLSVKTLLAGKKVVTVSASKIFHVGSASDVWKIRFTTYHLLKANMALLLDVYYKKTELARALMFNGLYILSVSVFNLKKKNVSAILGDFDAFVWSLRNLPYLWQNRLEHWSRTRISPEELKEKFVRVNLPMPVYLFPSKLNSDRYTYAIQGKESAILKR
jgi:GT2 family glycosyltransferase